MVPPEPKLTAVCAQPASIRVGRSVPTHAGPDPRPLQPVADLRVRRPQHLRVGRARRAQRGEDLLGAVPQQQRVEPGGQSQELRTVSNLITASNLISSSTLLVE